MKPEWIIAEDTDGRAVRMRLSEIAAYRSDDEYTWVWMSASQDDATFEFGPEVGVHLDRLLQPKTFGELL
jgi:hypothetical protein